MNQKKFACLSLALYAALVLTGCADAASDSEQFSATPVEITNILRGSIQTVYTYAGQIKPEKEVRVMSTVSGKVESVNFEVGESVNKDDILLVIDKEDIEKNIAVLTAQLRGADAAVATARFNLQNVDGSAMQRQIDAAYTAMQSAKLQLSSAETSYENSKAMYEAEAVSSVELTQAETAYNQAKLSYEQAAQAYALLAGSTVEENRSAAEKALAQAEASRGTVAVQLENARDMLGDASVRAPISGVITSRSVEAGATLSAAVSPCTIMQTDTVTVDVDVTEKCVMSLRPGMSVDLAVSSMESGSRTGTIRTVSPAADEVKNTYAVKIDMDNLDKKLKPGMLVSVYFIDEKREGVLVLPRSAVLGTESTYVFVNDSGTAKKVPVETGVDNGKEIEIVSGLSENDPVITTGQNFLKDGDPVSIVNETGKVE